MATNRLLSSSRTVEAEWIEDRLAPFGSGVTSIVPNGFEAYVRIFHPAREWKRGHVRWADVAEKSGRTIHRLAQFHAIHRPQAGDPDHIEEPWSGKLPQDLLQALCGTLAVHTTGLESCFFCIWEGYDLGSSGQEVLRAAVASEARVRLPHRDYLLFEGPLESATELGDYLYFASPNLFWPEDRGWCVASEIDLFCTLVGGTNGLVESILANPALEAWRVLPDDPINYYSDEINI